MDHPGNVIAVGCDLVDVARLDTALRTRPRLAERLFTAAERADAAARRDGHVLLAGRFAAKEASMKALGCGFWQLAWHDLEVRSDPSGAPQVLVHHTAAARAAELGVTALVVSIAHTAELAQATVLALRDPTAPATPPAP